MCCWDGFCIVVCVGLVSRWSTLRSARPFGTQDVGNVFLRTEGIE